ncbi:LytR/AlgR family response regulator transcription factor [Maribacter sp. 4G9]|uniref:LytR/AlgR family response regulator transcription factor n=1 Tax=Maribacter sp. 4G9 TaxID=1889777 RepID=UPI000C153D08|nr:LytTR family DNA-binding domain-containing protein [Maribacter sp. 4G9]PIB38522.1 DNA-binding response regulator [Maribacter sp. 4G9]
MIRAIIIDDELAAVNNLNWELQKFSNDIKVVETFTSPVEAISGINYLKPDCVFLDIEMPEMNGFALLKKLDFRNFAVIITTAYNQYAIQAIKENALDYLLKPIDGDEIKEIIQKLKNHSSPQQLQQQFQETIKALSTVNTVKMIQIPVNGKIVFIKVDEIIYCQSDGNYTRIFLDSGKNKYVSKKLKEVEELLPESLFFRIHNSYIINTLKVMEYFKGDGYVVLSNEEKIPVSRIKKDAFLEKMSF